MSMKRRPRSCPTCDAAFVPWNLWRVSRWTNISCPQCKSKLNRSYDPQLFLVLAAYVMGLIGLVWLMGLSLASLAASVAATAIIVYLLDVFTVRLTPAKEWRGPIRGYDV